MRIFFGRELTLACLLPNVSISKRTQYYVNPNILRPTLFLAVASSLLLICAGCGEKPESNPEPTPTTNSTHATTEAVKAAADKAGATIEHTAEKAWEGIKKGAHEAGHLATNVAAEVKTGAQKTGDKIKEAVNQ